MNRCTVMVSCKSVVFSFLTFEFPIPFLSLLVGFLAKISGWVGIGIHRLGCVGMEDSLLCLPCTFSFLLHLIMNITRLAPVLYIYIIYIIMHFILIIRTRERFFYQTPLCMHPFHVSCNAVIIRSQSIH